VNNGGGLLSENVRATLPAELPRQLNHIDRNSPSGMAMHPKPGQKNLNTVTAR
jgi:hypothetical protein